MKGNFLDSNDRTTPHTGQQSHGSETSHLETELSADEDELAAREEQESSLETSSSSSETTLDEQQRLL